MTIRLSRFSILDLYLGLICIFPITTMLIDGTILNKIIFVLLFFLHMISYYQSPIKRNTVIMLLILAIHYVFTVCATNFPMVNSNMLFYFPYFMMYTYFVCDNMDLVWNWLCQRWKYLKYIVWIWSLVVGISIFIPNCYYVKEGGELYFGSWVNTIFRLGPTAMFVQILVIVLQVMKKLKFSILYMIIPMYCVLMGSSRTYLVIGFCLFVICWYLTCRNRKIFWWTIIPVGLIFLVLVMLSTIGDKIAFTLDETQYGDFWFRISSARSVLWEQDLTAWYQMPVINQLLGCGLNLTYDVSGRWGHNDLIELLCGCGLLGVVEYMCAVRKSLKVIYFKTAVPGIVKVCAVTVWLFNAFFNMHYTYFCAMLSYPFLLMAQKYYYSADRTE